MVVIGLTGGICSGKSTVSGFLAELGAVTISADEIGHEAFQPYTMMWQEVVQAFGRGILKEGEEIDRQKLGEVVFNDADALARLNRIMHPAMHRVAKERIERLKKQGTKVTVLEAPLLVEANWLDLVNQVWVTTASESTVLSRCCRRSGLSEDQARARISSQLPPEERLKYADEVINTDVSLDEVRARVKELWERLCQQEATKEKIRQALSQRGKKLCQAEGLTRAAVLIPMYHKAGEWYLVLTKRTQTMEYHKGQISFPGGAQHEEDASRKDTALRESWEEIGLDPADVEILGELDDTATYTTRFLVSPFVGAIPYPYGFKANPEEVAEIIFVPLDVLLDKRNFREEMQWIDGQFVSQYFYRYGDKVIWGATARILKQFLEVIDSIGKPGTC
jgi:dephospho-CoA kinase